MEVLEDFLIAHGGNMIRGTVNLRDAVRGTTVPRHRKNGRIYPVGRGKRPRSSVGPGWQCLKMKITCIGGESLGRVVRFTTLHGNNHEAWREKQRQYFYSRSGEALEARCGIRLCRDAGRVRTNARGIDTRTVLIETVIAAFEDGRHPFRWRAYERTQLWALGYHIQVHQENPEQAGFPAARRSAVNHGPATSWKSMSTSSYKPATAGRSRYGSMAAQIHKP